MKQEYCLEEHSAHARLLPLRPVYILQSPSRDVITLFLSRHEKAAVVCRRGGGEIVAHAHRAVQGSIPVSQTFTERVFECIGIPLEPGKRTAVFRSECSVKSPRPAYPRQPPSRSVNTVNDIRQGFFCHCTESKQCTV